jgi:hypothetical protein
MQRRYSHEVPTSRGNSRFGSRRHQPVESSYFGRPYSMKNISFLPRPTASHLWLAGLPAASPARSRRGGARRDHPHARRRRQSLADDRGTPRDHPRLRGIAPAGPVVDCRRGHSPDGMTRQSSHRELERAYIADRPVAPAVREQVPSQPTKVSEIAPRYAAPCVDEEPGAGLEMPPVL